MNLFRKHKIDVVKNPRSKQKIKRESIVIHHYCPHTYNAGDHFVIRSIRHYLRRFLPEAVFIPKPCAFNRGWGKPVRLTGPNINFSNKYADAVIVGGSDQYNNWSLRIRQDEIPHLVPPFYLIGLGVSSKSPDQEIHLEKASYRADIRKANELARLSSVRDHRTQAFLESCGVQKSIVTGCPAMFLYDRPFTFDPKGIAALTFPFPVARSNNRVMYNRLIQTVSDTVRLLKQHDLKPVIVCHDDRDVPVAQQNFPELKLFFSNSVDEVLQFYEETSLVIGSRLHATILAAGMGKPFVNINLDARGLGFSETFQLSDWNISIDDPMMSVQLKSRLAMILGGKLKVFHQFQKIRTQYRKVFLKFMEDVAGDIRKSLEESKPGHGPHVK